MMYLKHFLEENLVALLEGMLKVPDNQPRAALASDFVVQAVERALREPQQLAVWQQVQQPHVPQRVCNPSGISK